ncbi:MAG: Endoribonuclease EndoA [Mycoplasmataceae bacterium]|nr:MAG: Endoribonuclease EndoA [Mycoplasmataceae bacterium]
MFQNNNESFPKRGEIWIAKLEKIIENSKDFRPVLIISDNEQNEFFDSVTVVPITTKYTDEVQDFEIFVKADYENGLDKDSKILLNLPFFINKNLRLKGYLGFANESLMRDAKKAFNYAFDW